MTTQNLLDEVIDYDFDEVESLLRAKYVQEEPKVGSIEAEEIVALRREVTKNKPHRLIMYATLLDGFTPQAQQILFGPKGMDGICSIAILYTDKTDKLAQAIAQNPENKIPVKAFSAKEIHAAEEWSLAQPIL